jgi:hypothetical protein
MRILLSYHVRHAIRDHIDTKRSFKPALPEHPRMIGAPPGGKAYAL